MSATVLLAQTQEKPEQRTPSKSAASKAPGVNRVPMDVKLGLWQSTTTITVSGGLGLPPEVAAKLTPEQRARYEAAMQNQAGGHTSTLTKKSCLTQEDLATDPFGNENANDENIHCHGTLLKSTSTDAVLQETCSGEASMTYTMKIHAADQEHATGTGTGSATMGGRTMNSSVKFDSKWLGATCSAKDEN
ncbi:MAG: DUF3617 family protein [Candidatus Acidiferrales bacterium]